MDIKKTIRGIFARFKGKTVDLSEPSVDPAGPDNKAGCMGVVGDPDNKWGFAGVVYPSGCLDDDDGPKNRPDS